MTTTVGITVFPGTNCEADVAHAVELAGGSARLLWHADRDLGDIDAVVVPGGFAHGDYLRTGAIARFSPVMASVAKFAESGGPVVGICNGFQILCEAGLLPGALQKNAGLKFLCGPAELIVASVDNSLCSNLAQGDILCVPINHFEGNYVIDEAGHSRLVSNDQVVLRYRDNPNGSRDDIAGICNEGRNVVGLMPHPERATHHLIGSVDGLAMFEALVDAADRPLSPSCG